MKEWVIELYKFHFKKIPFREIWVCTHAAGGYTIEWEEEDTFPMFPEMMGIRYWNIQHLIDCEHSSIKNK